MATAAAPRPQKVRYDGSACLNVRSVTTACNILGSASSAEPLRWSDLSSVLWFVETCITSRKLFFDGTVPKDTADRALSEVEQFKRSHELKLFEVSSISFEYPYQVLQAARDALAESKLLIDNFQIDPSIDKPLEQKEHENFVHQLEYVRKLRDTEQEEVALSWVSDAFRGSKCLAAVVANGDHALNRVHELYQLHGDRAPLVSGALINRFRLNYINQLAAKKSSAYVPDPGLETLTEQHIRLFKDYLLEHLVGQIGKEMKPEQLNIVVENMRSETPLPPIGLYALMATKVMNRPGAILETAYNEFRQDDGLMRLLWQNTKGAIAIKESGREHVSEIEQHFYDRYRTLRKEAEGIKVLASKSRTARNYLVPAVLKGLAKAIPDALPFGKIAEVVYKVLREVTVETSIPFLGDRLLDKGCDSYISQYKSLKFDLERDDAIREPLSKLADQVERVFGRKIEV